MVTGQEPEPVALLNQSIDPVDTALLESCVARVFDGSPSAVLPFTRYGRSEARLYLLRKQHGGMPLVVKTDTLEAAEEELRRAERLRTVVDDAWYLASVPNPVDGRAALYLRYQGEDAGTLNELDDVYMTALGMPGTGRPPADGEQKERALEQLLQCLERTYDSQSMLARAHTPAPGAEQKTFRDYYSRYAERASHPNRLRELFDAAGGPVRLHEQEVAYPLGGVDVLFDTSPALPPVQGVHGDLHLSNIVLGTDRPYLVDFAWSACDDHLMKDFVMMESSLRFMRFPRHMPPGKAAHLDRMMNEALRIDDLAVEYRATPDEGLLWCAYVMVSAVAASRRMLMACVDQHFPHHADHVANDYFRSLYLVLAGQQRFETFPAYRVAWNLHMLERDYVGN